MLAEWVALAIRAYTDAARQALLDLLALVATFYRDVMHLACRQSDIVCNVDVRSDLEHRARLWGPVTARRAIDCVAETESRLNLNANTLLCLESMAIRLARLTEGG